MTDWIQYDIYTGTIMINTCAKPDELTRVQLLDSSGSICEKYLLEENGGQTQLETSNWQSGTWFIRVEKKQEVQLKRILITK